MAESSSKKEERRELANNLSAAISPLLKNLNDPTALQLPELALRCAQFFHSLSQYCLQHYRNDLRQKEVLKTKSIKKEQKEQKEKGQRGRKKKEEDKGEEGGNFEKPEPPRKPLTAYIIYFQDKKQHFVERYPTLNLSELTKLIAKEWKELSDKERQVFLDRAAEDRKRYEEQMAHFKHLYGRIDRGLAEDIEEVAASEDAEVEIISQQAVRIEDEEPNPEPEEAEVEEVEPEGEGEGEAEMEAEDVDAEGDDVQEVQGEADQAQRSSVEGENNDSENNESSESAAAGSAEKDD